MPQNRTNSAGFTKSFEIAPCSRHRKITWALTMTVTRTLLKRCNWHVRQVKQTAQTAYCKMNTEMKRSIRSLVNFCSISKLGKNNRACSVSECVRCEETDLQGRSCCGATYEETDQTQTRFSNIGRLHHIFRSLIHLQTISESTWAAL